jgi:hypothetical protein
VRPTDDQVVRGLPDRTEIPPRHEPSSWSRQSSCGARVPPCFFTAAGGSNKESYCREPAMARIILTPKHFSSRHTSLSRSSPMFLSTNDGDSLHPSNSLPSAPSSIATKSTRERLRTAWHALSRAKNAYCILVLNHLGHFVLVVEPQFRARFPRFRHDIKAHMLENVHLLPEGQNRTQRGNVGIWPSQAT